jgi:hypothetical protein
MDEEKTTLTEDADYTDIDLDAIVADWSEGEPADAEVEEPETQDEADQQDSEPQNDEADTSETDKPEDETPPTDTPDKDTTTADSEDKPDDKPQDDHLTLKYMGEEIKVTREEAVVLAQKGKDYDRIRAERDTLKTTNAELSDDRAFLEELAGPMSKNVEQFKLDARAAILSKREGITLEQAYNRISAQRAAKPKPAEAPQEKPVEQSDADRRTADEQAAAAARDKDIKAFMAEYPGINPREIPPEVWAEVKGGKTLLAAYQKWENNKEKERVKALEAELEAARKAKENAKKSTGSRSSSGKSAALDPMVAAWYSDD